QLEGSDLATCDISGRLVMVHWVKDEGTAIPIKLEKARKAGDRMARLLMQMKRTEAQLIGMQDDPALTLALAEGFALGSYTFNKYKSEPKATVPFEKVSLISREVGQKALDALVATCEATFAARDLVNEPLSYLTAGKLADETKALGKKYGFKVQ